MTTARAHTLLPAPAAPLDCPRAWEGRRVLLTGVTGFLGKVWLAMALRHLPGVAGIEVLIRPRPGQPPQERFDAILAASPLFDPAVHPDAALLRERAGALVRVVAGDVAQPDCGLAPDALQRLRGELDIVVHCAGSVDFHPDIREAIRVNIRGAEHVATLVAESARGHLLHVSTCYVAGRRRGHIPEAPLPPTTPSGAPFGALACIEEVTQRVALLEFLTASEAGLAEMDARIDRRAARRGEAPPTGEARDAARALQTERLMIAEGHRQADEGGWPNTYTWSKALAEKRVEALLPPERRSLFRPAIVESSRSFPFAGWNEGFNTSGPLIRLIGTWFRHLPARPEQPFDVVPVDDVCRGLCVAGAALLEGSHAPVYQCGTSARNQLTIGRSCELTALGHRRKRRRGGNLRERVLAQWETLPVDVEHPLGPAGLRQLVQETAELLDECVERLPEGAYGQSPLRRRLLKWGQDTHHAAREMRKMEAMTAVFAPFVHEIPQVFACDALFGHGVEGFFAFDPEGIDWRSYWMDTHMPGLDRWCFSARDPQEART